jgi:hypothetical protein
MILNNTLVLSSMRDSYCAASTEGGRERQREREGDGMLATTLIHITICSVLRGFECQVRVEASHCARELHRMFDILSFYKPGTVYKEGILSK